MERMFKKFLSVATLFSVAAMYADTPVVSYYKARPQSLNGARKVSGEVPGDKHVHLFDMDEWYGTFWVTPEYSRTFRANKIAGCLFGDDLIGDKDCRTIKVQGSKVNNRDAKAWLADYFYLSEDFNGTLTFEPRISNFILDFNFYLGLDEWFSGGYFRIFAPFVHTRWDLNFKEAISAGASGNMGEGKFSPDPIDNTDLLKSAASFFRGEAPTSPLEQLGFDIERKGLCFAKMSADKCSSDCTGRRTENGFGDIRTELGWNFWQNEDYHFGLAIIAAAPTGDRPEAHFLFDAVVGNGKHWEVGGAATFHYAFWRSEDEEKHFGFYGDLNVTHLFNARQQRTFDLTGKPLSRYMLASKFGTEVTNNLKGAATIDTAGEEIKSQFANVFEPVANLTTGDVKVSVGAQVDLAAWFNYTSGGFSWDVGYNFWFSSCEKIKCSDKCPPRLRTEENMWALKGDANMFGFVGDQTVNIGNTAAADIGDFDADDPVALSPSQSGATIHKGTNQGKTETITTGVTGNGTVTNPGVDSARFATAQNGGDELRLHGGTEVIEGPFNLGNNNRNAQLIRTSFTPVFLKEDDMDLKTQRSRGLSHKIFTHFAYEWDREGWVPYLGWGGEAEFGKTESRNDSSCKTDTTSCPTKCDDCIDCAVSQWGVWLKVGFSFD